MEDRIPKIDERAMEEWRLLQSIIARHEGFEYQIRGWLLVLLGGLLAVLYSDKSKLSPTIFFVISMLVCGIFALMEIVTRFPRRKAIARCANVEASLRGEVSYDGPAIAMALKYQNDDKFHLSYVIKESQIISYWAFYLAVITVSAVIAVFSN